VTTYSVSVAVANAQLGLLCGTAVAANAYATSGAIFLQLHTADPGTAGTTSISVGSTTRVSATMTTPSAGSTANNAALQWTNGGTSETIVAVSYWSALTGGTYLGSGQLGASQAWASGNIIQIPTSDFTVALPTAA
jgi:hypothetical protein